MDHPIERIEMGERTIGRTTPNYLNVETSSDTTLHALREDKQPEIISQFSFEQQAEIRYKQHILSSLAYFIGKDFQIPVELNEPGGGWHWDFVENKIRIDPQDLLEKPIDYLRFVISHEGGHRRISRVDDIPLDIWQQPGFSFMMNAIEDPRTNNFIAEAYPKFAEQMDLAYKMDLDFEKKAKDKGHEQLGYTPRFLQAGFEYIRQWFGQTKGQESFFSAELPDEVRTVVEATLEDAKDSWLRYPSKQEADASEDLIRRYAQVSYEINRDKIWPLFKTLVESDMQNQQLQEMLQELAQEGESEAGEKNGAGMPQGLKDRLTEAEQKELSDAIQKALEQEYYDQDGNSQSQDTDESHDMSGKRNAIDLDSLSLDLKQKIQDYVDSLPDDIKEELRERAQKNLEAYEREVNEEIASKLADNPSRKAEKEEVEDTKRSVEEQSVSEETFERKSLEESDAHKEFREFLEQSLNKDENVYEEYRRGMLPLIDTLETDLREIFVARQARRWHSGFKTGKRVDIAKRMQEKALGISAVESRAWQKRELPQEKDYAISLLVDLSGSMVGEKIKETFKAAVVLAEVLNKLSINTEILGFNDKLYEYQAFGQDMGRDVRERMGGMLQEVHMPAARWNDDGWAVEQASERLASQKATEKFLFVLSDGSPVESPYHDNSRYDLQSIISRIMHDNDQKLIGLGIGNGTEHVARYYPNNIANINVHEMADKLADVIHEVIANYDTF